jgi:preprotein translocase subunit SecE
VQKIKNPEIMDGVKAYILESYEELSSKVTWPTFSEVQLYAVMVFIASLLIAGAVFFMDFVFGVQDTSFWKGILGFVYGLWS